MTRGSRRTSSASRGGRTLFISRKFPPIRGGMESAALNLSSQLAEIRTVKLIKFGLSNRWLPAVLPLLFVRGLWHALASSTDVVLLQDGVLAPLGVVLKKLTGKPVVVIVHGLEVTHTGPVHQWLMSWSLPRMTHIIAVSANTRDIILTRFPAVPTTVINNGVPDDFFSSLGRDVFNAELSRLTGQDSNDIARAEVLVTVGRLVPRKGVQWFVEEVLPLLAENRKTRYLYLIVGAGPERDRIEQAVARSGMAKNIRLLGGVSAAQLIAIYNRADVFVMPNISVPGDVEGFGIAALEASSTGTPVVAADVDGIADAVRNPGNGVLVATRDAEALARSIRDIDISPAAREGVRAFTLRQFSWRTCAESLDMVLDAVTERRNSAS